MESSFGSLFHSLTLPARMYFLFELHAVEPKPLVLDSDEKVI